MAGMRWMMAGTILLTALASTSAQATLITFDPDDYAAGTDVSNVNPYVELSTFRKSETSFGELPTYSGVVAANCSAECATTGNKVFGDAFGGVESWGAFGGTIGSATGCFQAIGQGTVEAGSCLERFNVLLMTFSETTDFVEISGRYWAQDETYLYGFDDSFNYVGQMGHTFDYERCMGSDPISDYCGVTTSLTSATGGIRYVIAGGWSNGTSLDNLRFNSVPEPGTLALLALGLAGVAAARRRKLASGAVSA